MTLFGPKNDLLSQIVLDENPNFSIKQFDIRSTKSEINRNNRVIQFSLLLYGVELIVVSGGHHDKADLITAIKEEAEKLVNLFFNEMAEKKINFRVYLEISSKYGTI